jgi:hypothetical protein
LVACTGASYDEFGVVADTANGAFVASQSPIEVMDFSSSSSNIRATTNLVTYFNVPNNSAMAGSQFVVMQLPWEWSVQVPTMSDGSWSCTAQLTKDVWDTTVVPATNTAEAIQVTCAMVSAGTIMVTPNADDAGNAVVLAENQNYTLTISSVPTPEDEYNSGCGSFQVGVGLTASGVTGRSSSQLWTVARPAMTVQSGMSATVWASASATVTRGTYSNTEVCVAPASGNFVEDVSFGVVAGTIAMVGDMSATLGDTNACGNLGAAQAAQLSTYTVYWTKTDGASYLVPSPMAVTVTGGTAAVSVSANVECALGGRSVPIMVTLGAKPHTGIEVSMTVVTYDATVADAVDPSAGITPDTTVLSLDATTTEGILGFACAAEVTGTSLTYVLAGTDAASFALSSASATVAAVAAKAALTAQPDMTITEAASAAGTAAQMHSLTGLCPEVGEGWLFVTPVEDTTFENVAADAVTTHTPLADYDAVVAAFGTAGTSADGM